MGDRRQPRRRDDGLSHHEHGRDLPQLQHAQPARQRVHARLSQPVSYTHLAPASSAATVCPTPPILAYSAYLWPRALTAGPARYACRAMFYNCDKDLLRYAWYRKPKVILRSFGIRLRRVALYLSLIHI